MGHTPLDTIGGGHEGGVSEESHNGGIGGYGAYGHTIPTYGLPTLIKST